VQQWQGDRWTTPQQPAKNALAVLEQTVLANDHLATDDDDPGLLDVVERTQEQLDLGVTALRRITSLMTEFTSSMNDSTAEAESLKVRKPSFNAKDAKAVINRAADRMNDFAASFEAESRAFGIAFGAALENTELALTLQKAEGLSNPAELSKLDESLSELEPAMRVGKDSLASFKASVGALPGLTVSLKKAKRNVQNKLEQFDVTIALLLDRATRLQQRIAQEVSNSR
jgi:hypothetical protein